MTGLDTRCSLGGAHYIPGNKVSFTVAGAPGRPTIVGVGQVCHLLPGVLVRWEALDLSSVWLTESSLWFFRGIPEGSKSDLSWLLCLLPGGFHPPHRMRDERALGVGLEVTSRRCPIVLSLSHPHSKRERLYITSIYSYLCICLPVCLSILSMHLSSICI